MTDTNTSLSTFRRCPREYDLRYGQQLELATETREPLLVGHSWHKAFEAAAIFGDDAAGHGAISTTAPSSAWVVKLQRLFAANRWYWQSQPFTVIEPEQTFRVELNGIEYEGQLDGVIEIEGRRGILERKTSGEDIGAESSYWDRLRLDVQVGLYALSQEERPAFILYDVTRKPTINPKNLTKAEVKRLAAELAKDGKASYYQETFDAEALAAPLEEGRESIDLYGARLTADIGDRPEFYFQRREVHRTEDDYTLLLDDLAATSCAIGHAYEHGFQRNPDSCNAFGRCAFFGLCSNNAYPDPTAPAPDGFRRREHRHPELVPTQGHNETP